MDLDGFLRGVGRQFATNIMNEIPTGVKVNLNPIKDFLLESKKPDLHEVFQLTGKKYRQEVMHFEDESKNYNQY